MTTNGSEAMPEALPQAVSQEAEPAPATPAGRNRSMRDWVWVLAICAPPLSLLAVPGREFGLDWPGHLWMTAYFGEYFRHHLGFPEVLNTDWISGMPYPVFYGCLLFPLAGLCSIALGADLAMRLILAGVLVSQCVHTHRLMAAAGASRGLAWIVAALFCWSTYFLTNLYNRGALPEFIGVALLSCSLSCFLRVLLDGHGKAARLLRVEAFFYYVLCAGTHPLTAVFGAILIAILMLATLPWQRREQWPSTVRWGALGVLATAMVLSPWIYATGQFHRDLAVHKDSMTRVTHFTESVDRWDVRLRPWPADGLPEEKVEKNLAATPHLDAQVNVPLLLLALAASVGIARSKSLRRTRLNGVAWAVSTASLVLFLVTFLASVSPSFFELLPDFCASLQFAYRLVAYQNLALLAMIAGMLHLHRSAGSRFPALWKRPLFHQGLLLLGLAGLTLKMTHATAAMRDIGPDGKQWRQNPDHLVHLPYEFYGWPAYGTPGSTQETGQPAEPIFFPVGTGSDFGRVSPIAVTVERPQERVIQVQPFPWSQVLIDGQPLAPGQARTLRQGYAVKLPAGTHEIGWRWQPDPRWSWLGILSLVTLAVWFCLTVRLRIGRSQLQV